MLLNKEKVWGGMVERELSDAQWKLIQPWLPAPKLRGRPRADDRRTINGVLYVLRTGCRWQDLPGEYGSSVTCWRRLNQWQEQGVWEDIWRTSAEHFGCPGSAGMGAGPPGCHFRPSQKGGDQVGLTHKGKGAKLMLVVDNQGIPLGALVASAQRAEITLAEATLATVRVPRVRDAPAVVPGNW